MCGDQRTTCGSLLLYGDPGAKLKSVDLMARVFTIVSSVQINYREARKKDRLQPMQENTGNEYKGSDE